MPSKFNKPIYTHRDNRSPANYDPERDHKQKQQVNHKHETETKAIVVPSNKDDGYYEIVEISTPKHNKTQKINKKLEKQENE